MAETDQGTRPVASDRAREFFERAYESFLAGSLERSQPSSQFNIADTVVRLDISGSLGSVLLRGLTHLRRPQEGQVDLTIAAWDTPAGSMIPPAWSDADYGRRGEIRGFNNGRFRTAFDHGTAALSMIDLETGRAIFWTRDATQLPGYENAAPLRTILSWWLQANHCLLIHAAAIARGGSGVLLGGPGGSGKSTTAFLCLAAGWNFLADDYCALNDQRVFSLYNSMKINERWIQLLPQPRQLAAGSLGGAEEKRIVFVSDIWPERVQASANCELVLLPRITNEKQTVIREATPAEGLRALAPTSMFQTPSEGGSMFQRIGEFVKCVPVRWLDLGSDTQAIPDIIARTIDQMR